MLAFVPTTTLPQQPCVGYVGAPTTMHFNTLSARDTVSSAQHAGSAPPSVLGFSSSTPDDLVG